ncbi:ArsC family transcriptional regulator [Treponema sp.]|uniref:arsenate reductase family protein n=1 Tax=Treponema sp. TaxID=166 RepID=UPI0025E53309|nr:ArsC family transcriptional regulator [Treponema sp.]MCR5219231.1 ArsC family transcriptional regulator [Treponema sp.]
MIQIFGSSKSFDCKAAQRFFKERRTAFQFIDLKEKTMSRGEFNSVIDALAKDYGSRLEALEAMVDKKSKKYSEFEYLDDSEKEEKIFDNQLELLLLPVCRNGKISASFGVKQNIWEKWL